MACGTMMICRTGLKEGSGFNPVPFETVGIIGGIMIDPEFFGKPEGDSVLKVLVQTLETLCWFYNGKRVIINEEQIRLSMINEMNYWRINNKVIGLHYSKRRDLELGKLPEETQNLFSQHHDDQDPITLLQ